MHYDMITTIKLISTFTNSHNYSLEYVFDEDSSDLLF